MRVLLQPNDPYIRVRGAVDVDGTELRRGTTYVARRSGSSVSVRTAGGRRVGRFAAPARFSAPSDRSLRLLGPALNDISNGRYRGAIEVLPDGGGVTAINVLGLDSYVRGVVAGEMPSSWPLEALKAQAVAARTYALATRKTTGSFDQYPDTRSQVYRGVTGESVRSDAAVAQTAGRILTYGSMPAVTYYFSTSGGHTENVEFSFIGALTKPWLVGVPDPYDGRSPYHRWRVAFSTGTLTRALGARGRFKRLKVLKRGVSPRVVRARVIGSRGSSTSPGPSIRARLGPAGHVADHRERVQLAVALALGPPGLVGPGPAAPHLRGPLLPRAAQTPPGGGEARRRALAGGRPDPDRLQRRLPGRGRPRRRVPRAGRRSGRARPFACGEAGGAAAGRAAAVRRPALPDRGAAPAAPGSSLRADARQTGYVRLRLAGAAPALPVTIEEQAPAGPEQLAGLTPAEPRPRWPGPPSGAATAARGPSWPAAADGRSATAQVRTPSCAAACARSAPRRVRAGARVRVRVADRWRLGDLGCACAWSRRAGRRRCDARRLADGDAALARPLPGLATGRLAGPGAAPPWSRSLGRRASRPREEAACGCWPPATR